MTAPSPKHPTYRVTAFNVGNMRVDKSEMSYGQDFGEKVDIPVWCAAVEGNGKRIIVDTGISDPEWIQSVMCPAWQAPVETMTGALDVLGWSPQSVDVVVNSHLHHDHCANNSAFANAEFFVSLAEWEYAQEPISTQTNMYPPYWLDRPLGLFDYTLVQDDHHDIMPGLRLIQTPGHTPGHQSLLVNTDEGTLCVSGDSVNTRDSLAREIPCGLLWSTADGIRSVQRVRAMADRVLMCHDPLIGAFQESGFPLVRELAGKDSATDE